MGYSKSFRLKAISPKTFRIVSPIPLFHLLTKSKVDAEKEEYWVHSNTTKYSILCSSEMHMVLSTTP